MVENTYATMEQADFSNANLSLMNFGLAKLKGARFGGAILVKADFTGADLTGVTLTDAHLEGAVFSGVAVLDKANLSNASVATESGTLSVERLGDDNTLYKTDVSYNVTILPSNTTTDDTICPDTYYGPCAGDSLIAPAPPQPPGCVPSLTEYCPSE